MAVFIRASHWAVAVSASTIPWTSSRILGESVVNCRNSSRMRRRPPSFVSGMIPLASCSAARACSSRIRAVSCAAFSIPRARSSSMKSIVVAPSQTLQTGYLNNHTEMLNRPSVPSLSIDPFTNAPASLPTQMASQASTSAASGGSSRVAPAMAPPGESLSEPMAVAPSSSEGEVGEGRPSPQGERVREPGRRGRGVGRKEFRRLSASPDQLIHLHPPERFVGPQHARHDEDHAWDSVVAHDREGNFVDAAVAVVERDGAVDASVTPTDVTLLTADHLLFTERHGELPAGTRFEKS